jgi:hypothetical protein
VRGHWKNHWHPSIREHRYIWITGYPRGDFTAGTVTGDKVLIASGPGRRRRVERLDEAGRQTRAG